MYCFPFDIGISTKSTYMISKGRLLLVQWPGGHNFPSAWRKLYKNLHRLKCLCFCILTSSLRGDHACVISQNDLRNRVAWCKYMPLNLYGTTSFGF